MRKITDIYSQYKIMPNLQLHQLQVAAVAEQFCDSLEVEADKKSIITACLLHDMGNIIKFNLGYFPEFLEPEGLEYWQNVQSEYLEKYGKDEHEATLDIAKELGMNDEVIKNIDAVGFHNWCVTNESENLNQKICTYADTRVFPKGVVSVKERLLDGINRYETNDEELKIQREMLHNCIHDIEKQIFIYSKIKPDDITDASIAERVEKLKDFLI